MICKRIFDAVPLTVSEKLSYISRFNALHNCVPSVHVIYIEFHRFNSVCYNTLSAPLFSVPARLRIF